MDALSIKYFLGRYLAKKLSVLFPKKGAAGKPQPLIQSNHPRGKLRARLSDLAGSLEAACQAVESDFIRIGTQLQAVYGDAGQLTQRARESVRLIRGENQEGLLFKMQGVVAASHAELEQCRNDISEKTAQISSIRDRLESLATTFPLIDNIGRHLRMVAVNIGIESVRSNQSAALFSVLADEIVRLSEKMKSISDGSFHVLKTAQDAQRSLYQEIAHRLNTIDRMEENARKIVADATGEIEKLMASTLQIAETASLSARQISHQVGKIVMAVQFHDSMSQRVDHITTALVDADEVLIEDDPEKLRHAHSIVSLQSAQLKDIISEIGQIYETAGQSFEEILGELDRLVDKLSELSAASEPTSDRQERFDSFENLRVSLEGLNSVLQKGQALMDPVRHAASRASETANQISGLVKDIHGIGFSTHLMALNAVVKAAHLGKEGSVLEVLAQEVKQCSDRSTGMMANTDDLIDRITTAAERLGIQSTSDPIDISLDDAMGEMTRTYDECMTTASECGRQADAIRHAITETMAALDFLPRLAETFSRSRDQLEAIAQELTAIAPQDHQMSQSEIDAFISRYTMEKEREIHAAALSGSIAPSDQNSVPEDLPSHSDQPALSVTAAPDSDPGQTVELFTDDATQPKTASDADPLPEPSDASWDNVELFDMDGASPETATDPDSVPEDGDSTEESDDFGDNVELF